MLYARQFQIEIYLTHSQLKMHGKVSFPITYSQEDFEYIFHQFASHFSLIEFEFNIIES
jgi:DMSO/TMAO reductase YedYZ molybdopterin-dependent catalytic subunit